jgi:hypothetical protein
MDRITRDDFIKARDESKRIDAEIDEVNKQIETLKDSLHKLEQEQASFDSVIATYKVLNSINDVSIQNTKYITLESNTKTTPIMDEFDRGSDKFLRLRYAVRLGPADADLIVTKMDWDIEYMDSNLTMTDLKKNMPLSVYYLSRNPPQRLNELLSELRNIGLNKPKSGDICSFTRPIRLGGQTYSNQTGFGSRYEGYDCVEEGTLYGDTTGFLIIGVIFQ